MGRKKILIVDDEKDILFVLENRLAMAGFDVISADSGFLALPMAKSQQPDLIMLDLQMPKIDGTETARRLKADPATQDIPILFLTCLLSSEESMQKEHSCGEDLVLAKSMDTAKLVSIINKLFFNVNETVPVKGRY
jgi:two-component system cell cycle response regulator